MTTNKTAGQRLMTSFFFGNMAHVIKVEFSDDISNLDYTQICRACLLQKENLISIFSEKLVCDNVVLSIVEMVKACASIQIFEGDGFPSQLCSNCFNQVLQAYAFRQQCEKADVTLHTNEYKNFKNNLPTLEDTESALRDDENSITIKEETICENQTVKKESEKCYQNVNKKTSKLKKPQNTDSKSSFQCKKCGIIFESNIILRDHTKEKHPYKGKEKICSICSKSIIGQRFAQHMRTHTQEKPFVCNVCGLAFSQSGNLRRHKMIHTGERPHLCPICNKGFIQAVALAEHVRTHTRETPFQCTICSKKFTRSGQFRLHVKRHNETENDKNDNRNTDRSKTDLLKLEKKFLCSECGKAFSSISILKMHSNVHTGKKLHNCADCGKSFARKGALKTHSVIHSGIKPYQCTVCNKSFNQPSILKNHSLLHTGEKPFSCTLCEKAFTQRHHLSTHIRSHSGEKPYECNLCGKRFAAKRDMEAHVRAHTGETPFHCSICGKGFYDSSSMKKHQKKHGNIANVMKTNETTPHDESNTA